MVRYERDNIEVFDFPLEQRQEADASSRVPVKRSVTTIDMQQ